VPDTNIPIALPVRLLALGTDQAEVQALLDQWAGSYRKQLQTAVANARKAVT
jgi:malonyl CoA-acyl carrier protein transacylase